MGNILSAIGDDMQEYEELCLRYGETVRYSRGSPDCYGEHAKSLLKRRDEDAREKKRLEAETQKVVSEIETIQSALAAAAETAAGAKAGQATDEILLNAERVRQILFLRAAGDGKRWHQFPHHGEQQTAHHCGQALNLLMTLHPDPSMRLVKALLWHDSGERVVGDMPSPAKTRFPELGREYERAEAAVLMTVPDVGESCEQLSTEEKKWRDAIDVLERYLFLRDQSFMGNRHAEILAASQRNLLLDAENVPVEVRTFVRIESMMPLEKRKWP